MRNLYVNDGYDDDDDDGDVDGKEKREERKSRMQVWFYGIFSFGIPRTDLQDGGLKGEERN